MINLKDTVCIQVRNNIWQQVRTRLSYAVRERIWQQIVSIISIRRIRLSLMPFIT